MLIATMIAHIKRYFKRVEDPVSYGSELERYIVSRNPQNTYEVEQLTRQFDTNISQGKLL